MPQLFSTLRRFGLLATVIAALVVAAASAEQPAPSYDLVIANGRVMDPESGLDAVRHVGIRGGTIEAISETPLAGARIIDATRHVVAPGFVDLHEHGQQEESYRMMVRDGVTSAFELEVGTANVAAWYAAREGGQIVNYGVSIGHIPARMKVLEDPGKGLLPAGIGGSGAANDAQMAAMEVDSPRGPGTRCGRDGLRQRVYAGCADVRDRTHVPGRRRRRRLGPHSHARRAGRVAGNDQGGGGRAARGCTSCTSTRRPATSIDGFLAAIQAARDAGQDVTTEAYPYGAGMTEIQSAPFDDWATWPDERFAQHQLVSTGERLTRKTFAEARKTGGTVIIHGRSEQQTRAAIASPLAMIASDGFIENGRGHPRTSGTYAKVLGRYVRDERAVTLMNALGRMTLEPARRLERRTPAMAKKGRVRVGADADLTIFDPATVIDRATYEDASIPSAGIPYVVVGGQVVVDRGQVTKARPGRAVRAPVKGR